MTATPISEEEFGGLLRSIKRTAFRFETRDAYAISFEREEYERFLAGSPPPPSQIDWWQSWLEQVARLTREGKTVSRVRVLAEPPSDYQRWMIWAAPWYAAAGEGIGYMERSEVRRLGIARVRRLVATGRRAGDHSSTSTRPGGSRAGR